MLRYARNQTQRLDRADVLGEHTETMTLLASVRALLTGGELTNPALRDAAEAALIAEVADALRHGDYDEAGRLVTLHEPLVQGPKARRSLSLHAAMADEAAGRSDEALARVEAVIAALDAEDRGDAADGLRLVAAAMSGDAGTEARGAFIVEKSDAYARRARDGGAGGREASPFTQSESLRSVARVAQEAPRSRLVCPRGRTSALQSTMCWDDG